MSLHTGNVIPIRKDSAPAESPPATDDLTSLDGVDKMGFGPRTVAEQHETFRSWRDTARVSVVMIGRDVAQFLASVLPHLAGESHEIIYLDTGSADSSRFIAEACGARVYDWVWRQDFAKARNEALQYATGDWIVSLDCDEVLDRPSMRRLNHLLSLAKPATDAFWANVAMIPSQEEQAERQRLGLPPAQGESNMQLRIFPRLLPNGKPAHWHHRVHEQVGGVLEAAGVSEWGVSGVMFGHVGYHDRNLVKAKCSRNREMLMAELDSRPEPCPVCGEVVTRPTYVVHYHMAKCASALGYLNEALDYASRVGRSEQCRAENRVQLMSAYRFWGELLRNSGQPEKAVRVWSEGRDLLPETPLFPVLIGTSLRAMGKRDEAKSILIEADKMEWFASTSAIPIGDMRVMACQSLAACYQEEAFGDGVDSDKRMVLLNESQRWAKKASDISRMPGVPVGAAQ